MAIQYFLQHQCGWKSLRDLFASFYFIFQNITIRLNCHRLNIDCQTVSNKIVCSVAFWNCGLKKNQYWQPFSKMAETNRKKYYHALCDVASVIFQQNTAPGSYQKPSLRSAAILKHGNGKQEAVFRLRSERRQREINGVVIYAFFHVIDGLRADLCTRFPGAHLQFILIFTKLFRRNQSSSLTP